MSEEKALKIYKENGRLQRQDIELTDDVARSIRERIFLGEAIYSDNGIDIKDAEGKVIRNVSKYAIDNWYRRGNAIMETGEILRDLIDKWRDEYRTKKADEKRQKLLEKAESTINFVQNLRTSQVKRYRKVIEEKDENGVMKIVKVQELPVVDEHDRPIRIQNPKLLSIKQKNAEFVAERLNKEVWGNKENEGNKVVFFDLGALRKFKEERDKENEARQGD